MQLMNCSGLTDPVDPTDALLDPRRRPRQLEMNNEPAPLLKIESFARSISGQQNSRPAGRECVNGRGALRGCQAAVQLASAECHQFVLERSQGVAILGEDDGRLA